MNEPKPHANLHGAFLIPKLAPSRSSAMAFLFVRIRSNAFRAVLSHFALCPIFNTIPRTKSLYEPVRAFCGHSANCSTVPCDHRPDATVPKIAPFSTRFRPKKQERPARSVSGSLFFCPSKSGKLPKLPKSKVESRLKVESR